MEILLDILATTFTKISLGVIHVRVLFLGFACFRVECVAVMRAVQFVCYVPKAGEDGMLISMDVADCSGQIRCVFYDDAATKADCEMTTDLVYRGATKRIRISWGLPEACDWVLECMSLKGPVVG